MDKIKTSTKREHEKQEEEWFLFIAQTHFERDYFIKQYTPILRVLSCKLIKFV